MSSDNADCLDALVKMYAHTVYLKVCMPQQPSLRPQCLISLECRWTDPRPAVSVCLYNADSTIWLM